MLKRPTALLLAILLSGCASKHGPRGVYLDVIRPDQRPPLVGAGTAADSLWGPADESERGDGIAESRRPELQRLVERFTPIIVLPGADHVKQEGRKLSLLPSDVHLFGDTLRLDLVETSPYRLSQPLNVALDALATDSLRSLAETALRYESDPHLVAVWYFDFPGENPRGWWQAYGRLRVGPDSARWSQPTVYAHPFLDAAGRVAIQYWYFYPFNDYLANHEGDWEHINVVPTPDQLGIEEVHYFFHRRSINLPQGDYRPEIVEGTHPVAYVGSRMYNIFDYPIRLLRRERNEGSHGMYPYPGEWEGTAGLGAPESIAKADKDSLRVLPHQRFRVVLTPEPSRIDYQRRPEVLHDWIWLLLPVRWGFPSAPSLGSGIKAIDVGNRAPFGPAYNAGWNRSAPGFLYPAFHVRKLHPLRSMLEDLLQPWYYLYIFRQPRYVHDTRGTLGRDELERLGLAPRGGWHERGFGSTGLGVHLGIPAEGLSDLYATSTGVLLWRNFWAKLRIGAFELLGGYQKFKREEGLGGSLFVYPITLNVVVRTPDAWLRPYLSLGAGAYGWESRVRVAADTQLVSSGWEMGWTTAIGVEYYLRPRIAFDVALRYHSAGRPESPTTGLDDPLRLFTLWIGHYVRL